MAGITRGINRRENESGFTLIELAVVMLIISILSALGFANYSGFQSKASDAATQSDFHHLVKAMDILTVDEHPGIYTVLDLAGPAKLPAPLESIPISEGMIIDAFTYRRIERPDGPYYVKVVLVGHEKGSYRMLYTQLGRTITSGRYQGR